MKKLLIAAMAASIVLTFASCGDTQEEAQEATTTTTTAAEETTTTTTAEPEEEPQEDEEEPEEEEEEPEDEPEDDEDGEDDKDDEDKDDGASATAGKLFDVTADDDWAISDDAFGNTTITYKGTDIEMAADTCTVLINSQEIPDLNTMSITELGPLFKDSMGLGDALTVNNEEETTFNGYEAYIFDGVYTSMGLDFDLRVIVAREDNTLLVICPMTYSEVTEAIQPKIQKIVDSVKIK